MLWRMTHRDKQFRAVDDGQVLRSTASSCTPSPPRATPPARSACYAPELGAVFSGDTLFQGGPGRHRAVVLRLPDHPRVDQGQARQAARRHRRLHRPRRHHHDRRRDRELRRVGGPRPLNDWCGPGTSADSGATAVLRGSMRIFACVSGSPSASKAADTPSSPTLPVISGCSLELPVGQHVQGVAKFQWRVTRTRTAGRSPCCSPSTVAAGRDPCRHRRRRSVSSAAPRR